VRGSSVAAVAVFDGCKGHGAHSTTVISCTRRRQPKRSFASPNRRRQLVSVGPQGNALSTFTAVASGDPALERAVENAVRS
jgi:hypothetical protein